MSQYFSISSKDKTLREYQQKAKESIFYAWDKFDNVMFQMPTGTGKTRLFTSLIKDILLHDKRGGKIVIIAHRKELIDQISKSLSLYQIDHALIISGKKRDLTKRVQVASIASIMHAKTRNKTEYKELDIDYIIIDEAHHAMARTYAMMCQRYRSAKKLGVTATPWRMNHSGFMFFDCYKRKQEYFQKLIKSKPISWFIENHYLAPYTYYSIQDKSETKKLIDSIKTYDKFGDYAESELVRKFNTKVIRARLLESYLKLAKGKKGIIYAINQAHGKDICRQYEEAGLKVAYIDSNTKQTERDTIIERFKKGVIEILVNVNIFSEGFDCPDIEFIQLGRPTKSLAMYLQQVGRGLRPTKDKSQCVILDNVGLYSTFGLPDANRQWEHHFKGAKVEIDEHPTKANKGLGVSVPLQVIQGNEDMVMIQSDYSETQPSPKQTRTEENDLLSQVLRYIHETPGIKASEIAQSIFGNAEPEQKKQINSCLYNEMKGLWERDGKVGGYYLSMEGQKRLRKIQGR